MIVLHLNGMKQEVSVPPDTDLLSVLRNTLDLTGTKYGCGEGACGMCTVLLEGRAIRSCITPVSAVQGKELVTIEGLEKDGSLHPVQEAFLQTDPFQCSFCASGMIMCAVALLNRSKSPSEDEIIQAMNGNVCRCGTYPGIMKAIRLAIKQ